MNNNDFTVCLKVSYFWMW